MHGSLHRNQKAQKDVAPEAVWGGGGDIGEACLGVRLRKFETFSFAALFLAGAGGCEAREVGIWIRWDGGGKRGEAKDAEDKSQVLNRGGNVPRLANQMQMISS